MVIAWFVFFFSLNRLWLVLYTVGVMKLWSYGQKVNYLAWSCVTGGHFKKWLPLHRWLIFLMVTRFNKHKISPLWDLTGFVEADFGVEIWSNFRPHHCVHPLYCGWEILPLPVYPGSVVCEEEEAWRNERKKDRRKHRKRKGRREGERQDEPKRPHSPNIYRIACGWSSYLSRLFPFLFCFLSSPSLLCVLGMGRFHLSSCHGEDSISVEDRGKKMWTTKK